jgi:hypothetical protein
MSQARRIAEVSKELGYVMPQRDYRKELWSATVVGLLPAMSERVYPNERAAIESITTYADAALAAFDARFPASVR